jgi:hypothetical protein
MLTSILEAGVLEQRGHVVGTGRKAEVFRRDRRQADPFLQPFHSLIVLPRNRGLEFTEIRLGRPASLICRQAGDAEHSRYKEYFSIHGFVDTSAEGFLA